MSLLGGISLQTFAESFSCEEYKQIKMSCSVSRDQCLQYDVTNNGTIIPPYVDSVWIAKKKEDEIIEIIQVYYNIQSSECINISFLERGYYILYVQMKDCIMGCLFFSRASPADIEPPVKQTMCNKILRDGQLFIEHHGKTFTILGEKLE